MDVKLPPMSEQWVKRNQPQPQHTRCRYFADDFVIHDSDCDCDLD